MAEYKSRENRFDKDDKGGRHGRQKKDDKFGKRNFVVRKKICRFCVDSAESVNYKDPVKLRKFITEKGKILPMRITGNCAKHQRMVSMEVKKARYIAVLPYVGE